jgi:DNA-binding MarR family transcriptional regulator
VNNDAGAGAGIFWQLCSVAPRLSRELADAMHLATTDVEALFALAQGQPASIPEVAARLGRGYRTTQDALGSLRARGLVLRKPSKLTWFFLSDSGVTLLASADAMVWQAMVEAHGQPAALATNAVLAMLAEWGPDPLPVPQGRTVTSSVEIAAKLVGVEPHVVQAWVRSRAISPAPWSEDDLHTMQGLPGNVDAVWPDLVAGARQGTRFVDLAASLGLTTQKVAMFIWRNDDRRAELDEALVAGRDPNVIHGRGRSYRAGCWCPDCRRAQLGR